MAAKATLRDWFMVTRPWSIVAPLVPFLVGLGLVHGLGLVEIDATVLLRWAAGLVSGMLLVLSCNLFNTWGDERSGVDRAPGAFLTTPQVQEGKFTLREIFIYGAVLFAAAALVGAPTLFCRGESGVQLNYPLLICASIGFFGAVNYSTLLKFKYLGLGVPYVAFMEGTLYVTVVAALLAPGFWPKTMTSGALFSLPIVPMLACILHGNDMRDIATDRAAAVRSLAASLGPRGSLAVFIALHAAAYLACIALALSRRSPVLALPCLTLPLSVRLSARAVRDWRANPAAPAWLECEQGTGQVYLPFGVLYAIGLYFFA